MKQCEFIFGCDNKTCILLDDNYIRIKRKTTGNEFDREILLDVKSLVGYQIKKPKNNSDGFIKLIFDGNKEDNTGIETVYDRNVVIVTERQGYLLRELVDKLEILIKNKHKKVDSIATELEKLDLLLSQKKITPNEFRRIKDQLIN